METYSISHLKEILLHMLESLKFITVKPKPGDPTL